MARNKWDEAQDTLKRVCAASLPPSREFPRPAASDARLSWPTLFFDSRAMQSGADCFQVKKGSLKEQHHRYEAGDHIPLLANVVGPYANRSETREYYTLPFCQPEGGVEYIDQDFGEHLAGDRCVRSIQVIPSCAHRCDCTVI